MDWLAYVSLHMHCDPTHIDPTPHTLGWLHATAAVTDMREIEVL